MTTDLHGLATLAMRSLDPEYAHALAIKGLKLGLGPRAPADPLRRALLTQDIDLTRGTWRIACLTFVLPSDGLDLLEVIEVVASVVHRDVTDGLSTAFGVNPVQIPLRRSKRAQ